MMNSDIVILQPDDLNEASEILVRAFNNDPMFGYLGIKVEEGRSLVDTDALKSFVDLILRNCQPYNSVYTITGDRSGVAVWVPPGKSEMSTWQFLLMLSIFYWKYGWERTKRCWILFSSLDKRHRQEIDEPHWMLSLLGVAPSDRGRGIGSLLLQPVLQQADREGLSCYLSTFNERAVSFYQKHGFAILWQGELSKNSPCIWTMKRKPQF